MVLEQPQINAESLQQQDPLQLVTAELETFQPGASVQDDLVLLLRKMRQMYTLLREHGAEYSANPIDLFQWFSYQDVWQYKYVTSNGSQYLRLPSQACLRFSSSESNLDLPFINLGYIPQELLPNYAAFIKELQIRDGTYLNYSMFEHPNISTQKIAEDAVILTIQGLSTEPAVGCLGFDLRPERSTIEILSSSATKIQLKLQNTEHELPYLSMHVSNQIVELQT